MAKINLDAAPIRRGTRYPAPYDQPCRARHRGQLGDAAGLDQFGVNLLRLPAGGWSSQRHWHETEDEFIYVLEGEVVLVTDAGEERLRAGDCAGFKAGVADAHHLQNRSGREALILEVGTRNPDGDGAHYPDIDLDLPRGARHYTHRDGTPY
ncbi:Cupin 2 conserved barrel domain protein [mine drainage metagenome]|uniref:Cupin 2 conserved barrel domain protein n=2 Tax=mine drainage metagenome TaxID=410659 RepID=T1CXE2_9ZZZZ